MSIKIDYIMRFRSFCILGREAGSSTAGPTAGGPAVAWPSHAGRGRYPYKINEEDFKEDLFKIKI